MNTPSLLTFLFFGEDVFSLAVLESLFDAPFSLRPLAVVILEPVTVSGNRLVNFCDNRDIPVIRTQSVRTDEFLSHFVGMDVDLIVSAHFQRLLPASLFNRAKLGALNLHPSLLPRYRGMSPQHWPIILGDTETGVTVHRIDEGVDTGRILRQIRIPLEPGIYIHELQRKFLDVYRTVVVEAIERVIAGEPGELQSRENYSYFPKITRADVEITADTDVERAGNMVRAFSFPYAGAQFGGVRIMKAERADEATWIRLKHMNAQQGLIDDSDRKFLLLKDGALILTKWRNE